MNNDTAATVEYAATQSGLEGYGGVFRELGGGEVNDTYVLECVDAAYVLRICRYTEYRHLHREAASLQLLDIPQVPKVVYFDESNKINGRPWIMETYVEGHSVDRLTEEQYRSFGRLLAKIHGVVQPLENTFDYWDEFVVSSKHFGTEHELLNHPDKQLCELINAMRTLLDSASNRFELRSISLTHLDTTPSNILALNDDVRLIDWEFSGFKDPMADFAASYYDDIEFNHGKWRPKISNQERRALFDGYTSEGGVIDEDRLRVWMQLDKLKAAVFLYWRIRQTSRNDASTLIAQYEHDFTNIIASLENNSVTL